MEKLVNKQNLERYRDLLTWVSDEELRNQIMHLMAEEEAKDALATVPWRVEILIETIVAGIAALPADMQARFLRLAERIASAGLESLGEPHVKHLEGTLWELRLTGRDGIARALYVIAIGRRVVVVRAFIRRRKRPHAPRSNSRYGEQMRSRDNPVRRIG